MIPAITLVITPFYGFADVNLSLMFFGIGLAMAAVDGPVNRETAEPVSIPVTLPVAA